MTQPAIVITGASGFVGRHLLDELKSEYRIFAIARRSQKECGAAVHSNIAWMRVDIGDRDELVRTFREIRTAGGAKYLFHLAAYYDFEGESNPEYKRTNVEGTRNILEVSKELGLSRFFFSSSVAACAFPNKGSALDEASPANGDHIYAWSKRLGEQMVAEYSTITPTCVIRFGAVYSDWCEYPPLYMFLKTWLGHGWNARILGGKGESAIPYIHIREVVDFLRRLLRQEGTLNRSDVLIASTSGCTSHKTLFSEATRSFYGKSKEPIRVPALLAGWGIIALNLWGQLTGNRPFERPWMRRYIDDQLAVDNSRTCSRLDWYPEARFRIDKRLPHLIERLKSDPIGWHTRNLAVIRRITIRPELPILQHLSRSEEAIVNTIAEYILLPRDQVLYPYLARIPESELRWYIRLLSHLLLTSIQTGNRLLLLNYLEITSRSRFEAGCSLMELTTILERLRAAATAILEPVPELEQHEQQIFDSVIMPIALATEEIEEQYRLFKSEKSVIPAGAETAAGPTRSVKEQLEDTIWTCLVQRK